MGKTRTRFAPSPTGFMHIGNLRTALFAYLIARADDGKFVLRIEDTDRGRLVEGSVDVIYDTLRQVGLKHDEGPDIGGPYAPYVQSERRDMYRPAAEALVKAGKAYYCFCTEERLEGLKNAAETEEGEHVHSGYDRHCRDLDEETVQRYLAEGRPYVIRQKMPLEGQTTFHDVTFGDITVENKELEDQILLKSDGYPTYNFANVIDDHAMGITHVVRGSEYLSSTPKYDLLYEALGYEIPVYVHLPLILGEDGNKLSKRHGSTSFAGLVEEGYLPEAIVNYIAFLGWSPGGTEEIYSLAELEKIFSLKGISKSPAVFDYNKLAWYNSIYIQRMDLDKFTGLCRPYFEKAVPSLKDPEKQKLLAKLLQPRLKKLTEIADSIRFLETLPEYDPEIYVHKKMKTDLPGSLAMLEALLPELTALSSWDEETLHSFLIQAAETRGVKNGQVMWPVRIAAAGQAVTPGGAVEILVLLGREESLRRLAAGIEKLKKVVGE